MFFKDYFTIPRSTEQEADAVTEVRKGVNFKGSNLWILICAILIASLGLNVNSTAVIIGAMLISPLMGPIIGMGYSIGTYDFDLLKRSFQNFMVATAISILTATIYFIVTPLDTAQSEILARTSPTFYDICIALAGGIAGVIALGTRDKGNVVPGVAIATALMPPLCTAGFGIATGNWPYAVGAFFLFFINVVFIGTATVLGVKMMGFKKCKVIEKKVRLRLTAFILAIVLIAFCPAVYMTVGIVKQTLYEKSAAEFIDNELAGSEKIIILDRKVSYEDKSIRLVLVGDAITEEEKKLIESHLGKYGLNGTRLTILQGQNREADINTLKTLILEDFYKVTEEKISSQQDHIETLEQELASYKQLNSEVKAVTDEAMLLFPEIESLTLARAFHVPADSDTTVSYPMAIIQCHPDFQKADTTRIQDWLILRIGMEDIRVLWK